MSVHPSPVETTNNTKNALVKLWKFRFSVRYPPICTSANKYTPRMEYKYSNKKRSPPTLAMAGRVMMKVLNTIYSFLASFTSLRILPTLKALRMLVAPPKLKLVADEIPILISDPITITKSKMFHPCLK